MRDGFEAMGPLVGLAGPAGVGKSFVAEAFVRRGWRRVAFAAPLKAMMGAFFRSQGLSEEGVAERLEGTLKEAPDLSLGSHSPRYAMQTLGTEWGRVLIAPDIWTRAWRRAAIAAFAEGAAGVVADDVRFPNEVDVLRSVGGVVVGVSGGPRMLQGPAPGGHASEAGVEADFTVWNSGAADVVVETILARIANRAAADDGVYS